MSIYIVYKTTNLVNGKIYVGIHKQKTKWFDGYFGSGILLQAAIKKYGIENFVRETLHEYETLNECRKKEYEIVDVEFCKRKDTYNISIGGTGGDTLAGYDADTIKKMRVKAGNNISSGIQKKIDSMGEEEREAFMNMRRENMLKVRIQPNNKGRKHTGKQLENIIAASHAKGKIWCNNGSKNKAVYPDEPLSEGYVYGRVIVPGKGFKGHNPETLLSISKERTGKIYCNNGVTSILVKDESEIPPGYVRGLRKQTGPSLIWINDGEIEKKHPKHDSMPEGWQQGRMKRKKNE